MEDIGRPVDALLSEIRHEFGDVVQVEVTSYEDGRIVAVEFQPAAAGALRVSVVVFGSGEDFVLQAGHEGGRWQLTDDSADVAFARDVIYAVADGRVSETFAPNRSHVEVSLADGTVAAETGSAGLRGCLPLPNWSAKAGA